MRSRFSDPETVPAAAPTPREGGPTFSLRARGGRLLWTIAWIALAAWTPPAMRGWRRGLLRLFGARLHDTAIIRSSARIWWPANLTMDAHASLGPGAICYNVAPVTIGEYAIVSQRAHLCAAGHDVDDPAFPLVARPIAIGRHGWVAAEAFVGPGVTVAEGAVLGARGVAMRALEPWTIYAGNPAKPLRARRRNGAT
jgi:putative colanic acid biosynthesis acetyltransferase WcaF